MRRSIVCLLVLQVTSVLNFPWQLHHSKAGFNGEIISGRCSVSNSKARFFSIVIHTVLTRCRCIKIIFKKCIRCSTVKEQDASSEKSNCKNQWLALCHICFACCLNIHNTQLWLECWAPGQYTEYSNTTYCFLRMLHIGKKKIRKKKVFICSVMMRLCRLYNELDKLNVSKWLMVICLTAVGLLILVHQNRSRGWADIVIYPQSLLQEEGRGSWRESGCFVCSFVGSYLYKWLPRIKSLVKMGPSILTALYQSESTCPDMTWFLRKVGLNSTLWVLTLPENTQQKTNPVTIPCTSWIQLRTKRFYACSCVDSVKKNPTSPPYKTPLLNSFAGPSVHMLN